MMEKFPLLARPHRYAFGGGMLASLKKRIAASTRARAPSRKSGALSVMEKFPVLSRPNQYGHGGRMHRGRGPLAMALSKIPILGLIAGPIAEALGKGRRGGAARRHMVQGHTRYTAHGPVRVRPHAAKNPAGAARSVGGALVRHAMTAHGATAGQGRHRVAPHVRHTAYGPVMVKGHYAHGKGGSMLRAGVAMMAPRMMRAMTANLHPSARHYVGRGGLLMPA